SIFYMGINLGATIGQILCPIVGEKLHWHWGFSLAGFGMVLGLIQYKLGAGYLAGAGELKTNDPQDVLRRRSRNFYLTATVVALLVVLFGFLVNRGAIDITLQQVARALGYGIIIAAIVYFVYLLVAGGYDRVQKLR